MSSDMYRRQLVQRQKDLATLLQSKAKESEKAAQARKKASESFAAARKATNSSVAGSKMRDATKYESDAANHDKRVAEFESKIARKHGEINDSQKSLDRELDREARKRQQEEAKRQQEHERRMKSIGSTLNRHDGLHKTSMDMIRKLADLPEKIVVLFLASNPLDQQELRLDEEVRAIGEMIRKAKHRDAVKLESRWAVRAFDVLQAINEHQPRVVHFSGHGSDLDEIVFQDNAGNTKAVSMEAIVQTMASASDEIQLVFFNTCYSYNQAEAVAKHVGAAIGMSTSIGDDAARIFAAQFYSAIGFGLSLQRAFEQGKAAVMLEGIAEQDTPQLFVRADLDSSEIYLVRPPEHSQESHSNEH